MLDAAQGASIHLTETKLRMRASALLGDIDGCLRVAAADDDPAGEKSKGDLWCQAHEQINVKQVLRVLRFRAGCDRPRNRPGHLGHSGPELAWHARRVLRSSTPARARCCRFVGCSRPGSMHRLAGSRRDRTNGPCESRAFAAAANG